MADERKPFKVPGSKGITVPVGNTAQRPASPDEGVFRYNTDSSSFEGYVGAAWSGIGGAGTSTWVRDQFTGNGSNTQFTLSQQPSSEDNLIVFEEGVFQDQDAYTISGNNIVFASAPTNLNTIIVYTVRAAVSGSNLNQDAYTANGTQTAFGLSISPIDENNTQVFLDGVYQHKDGYSVSGNTLTFSAAPSNGTKVEIMTFTQTTINQPGANTVGASALKSELGNTGVTVNATGIHIGQDIATTSNVTFNIVTANVTGNVTGNLTGNVTGDVTGNVTGHVVANSIVAAGHIIPNANVTYDLGNTTNAFRDLYLSGSTITLGSQTLSSNATHISIGTAELSAGNGMAFARQEDIDTAVANLVASAPGTLDTLNELAAALGNDASFSTTVTNNLALKAPLANPTFSTTIKVGNDLEFITGANPRIDFDAGSSGSLRIFSTSTASERARFTSGGSFGLGTTNPQNRLHVTDGDVQIELEATSGAANNSGFIDFDGTNLQLSTNRDMKTGSFRDTAKSWAGMSLIGAAGGSEVRFYTATASNTAASQRMTIDQSGDVGIGETSPSYKLDFGTNSTMRFRHSANGTAIRIGGSDNDVNLIRFDGATGITDSGYYGGSLRYMGTRASLNNALSVFMDNAVGTEVEAMTIIQDGKVGIGQPTPSTRLTVGDGTGTEYITIDKSTTGESGILFKNAGNNKGKIILDSSEILNFYINNTINSMAINESGHVHFGQSLASVQTFYGTQGGAFGGNASHNVRGAGALFMFNAGGSNGEYIFECNGQNKLGIASTGVATHQSAPSSDSYTLRIATTNTADPGLSMWRSGQVGFGIAVRTAATNYTDFQVTSGSGEPSYGDSGQLRIHANDDVTMPGDHVYNTNDGFDFLAGTGRVFQTFNYDNTGAEVFLQNNRFASGTVAAFQYRISNSPQTGGTIYGSTSGYTGGNFSDYRLKNNVTNLAGSLDKICQLRAVSYNHVATPDKTELGFIAHEIADIFPEFVHGEKDAVWTQEDIDNYQGHLPDVEVGDIKAQQVEYFSKEWTTHILLAIKELKQKNDELKARIEALENA